MPGARRASVAVSAVLIAATALAACSGDDGAAPATTLGFGPPECAPAEPGLLVDAIDDAVAAVEAELGGPQRYFEINATPLLVNLFVADLEAELVTPYAYVGGELSSREPLSGAQGFVFSADSIDIDPQRVLSCVAAELPETVLDVFFVEGADGGVRYTVLTSNDLGGQLTVEVNGQGQVLSVETI